LQIIVPKNVFVYNNFFLIEIHQNITTLVTPQINNTDFKLKHYPMNISKCSVEFEFFELQSCKYFTDKHFMENM
jgi:hypothetical protein